MTDSQKKEEEATKSSLAQVRKAHNAWDKAKRDMNACVLTSMNHEATKGCKFEKDISSTIVSGNKVDETLVLLETKAIQGNKYTNEDLQKITTETETLKGYIKTGTRLTQALKAWFNILF